MCTLVVFMTILFLIDQELDFIRVRHKPLSTGVTIEDILSGTLMSIPCFTDVKDIHYRGKIG